MKYQTFEPNLELSAFIKCYWTLDASKEKIPEKQRIVPDGCMEMIFHYGDFFKQYISEENTIIQPKSFVFGQITKPLDIEPLGETGIFAIRFQFDGFMPFATIPLAEMTNKAVSLEILFGNEGIELENQILTSNPEKRIEIIEVFLLKRLKKSETIDKIVKSCVEVIIEKQGQSPIDELSIQLKINRRTLERRFRAAIGMSPKQILKAIRIQNVLKQINQNNFDSFTEMAYENGYFDQAHFIKDFKEFTGLNPKQYFSKNLQLTSLFAKKA